MPRFVGCGKGGMRLQVHCEKRILIIIIFENSIFFSNINILKIGDIRTDSQKRKLPQ